MELPGAERRLHVAGPLDPTMRAEVDQVLGLYATIYKEAGLHPDNSGESVNAFK